MHSLVSTVHTGVVNHAVAVAAVAQRRVSPVEVRPRAGVNVAPLASLVRAWDESGDDPRRDPMPHRTTRLRVAA